MRARSVRGRSARPLDGVPFTPGFVQLNVPFIPRRNFRSIPPDLVAVAHGHPHWDLLGSFFSRWAEGNQLGFTWDVKHVTPAAWIQGRTSSAFVHSTCPTSIARRRSFQAHGPRFMRRGSYRSPSGTLGSICPVQTGPSNREQPQSTGDRSGQDPGLVWLWSEPRPRSQGESSRRSSDEHRRRRTRPSPRFVRACTRPLRSETGL